MCGWIRSGRISIILLIPAAEAQFKTTVRLILAPTTIAGSKGNYVDGLTVEDLTLGMLEQRPPGRRGIILIIAEKRDRGSAARLTEVMERVQRMNATVYWLTYSPFLQPFTGKPKTREDLKPDAERIKGVPCAICPAPDDRGVPLDVGPGGAIYALGELLRLHQPDLAALFTKVTGGRTLNFLKKSALEEAIQLVSDEVHRQYILSFQSQATVPGTFHALKVVVKDRPELRVKTRDGYWPLF